MNPEDDTTRQNQIPRRTHSGEWSALDEVLTRLDRIEGKVDRNFRKTSELGTQFAVLENRVTTLEEWQDRHDERTAQWSLGTWLSIIGSVAGPIATFVILCLFGKNKG